MGNTAADYQKTRLTTICEPLILGHMKLQEWIEKEGLSQAEFARMAGLSKPSISQYINGSRTPNKAAAKVIFEKTGGKVTPNDFWLGVVPS